MIICNNSFYLRTTKAIWMSSTQDYYQYEATLVRPHCCLSSSSLLLHVQPAKMCLFRGLVFVNTFIANIQITEAFTSIEAVIHRI